MVVQRLVAMILLFYQRIQQSLRECSDFESFERRVQHWLGEIGRETLDIVFQSLDAKLMQERGSTLRLIGFRERTMATVFGEIYLHWW